MNVEGIELLLRRTMGLSAETVGRNSVHRAVQLGLEKSGFESVGQYYDALQKNPDLMQMLIEQVVVPETWFFRDAQPFAVVAELASRLRGRGRPIRILSVPCATGEEPYSLAISLLEAGFRPAEFAVEAIDISAVALVLAQRGIYGPNSFRGDERGRRDAWFHRKPDGWHIDPRVKEVVDFHRGNIVDDVAPTSFDRYDFIFCRNLLIYFDQTTQAATAKRLQTLLAPEGVVFVGHAEAAVMLREGLEPRTEARSFAFGHRKPATATKLVPSSPAWLRPTTIPRPVVSRSISTVRNVGTLTPPASASSEISFTVAESLADAGRLEEAERMTQACLQIEATPEAFYLLGVIRDSRGASAQAEAAYRKVLYLNPRHTEALAQLALIMEERGDHAAAQRYRARARKPDETGGAS